MWAAAAYAGGPGEPATPSAKAEQAALPRCPVCGVPASWFVKKAADAGPIFFCCPECLKRFEAEPGKYDKEVAAQRELLAKLPKVQVRCPISGRAVDSKMSVEHDGQKVYFCGPGCMEKYRAKPADYAAALADCYTWQTNCPVMGHRIDPTALTVLPTGETIYFCCKGCDKKLLEEPAKYDANLVAQGIRIDWAKVKKASADKEGNPHAEP